MSYTARYPELSSRYDLRHDDELLPCEHREERQQKLSEILAVPRLSQEGRLLVQELLVQELLVQALSDQNTKNPDDLELGS